MAITKVEYYVNDEIIGTVTQAPFNEYVWDHTTSAPGSKVLSVKIYVDGELSNVSPPVNISVSGVINFPLWSDNSPNSQQYLDAIDSNLIDTFTPTITQYNTPNRVGRVFNYYDTSNVEPHGYITVDNSRIATRVTTKLDGTYIYTELSASETINTSFTGEFIVAGNGAIYSLPGQQTGISKAAPGTTTFGNAFGTVTGYHRGVLAENGHIYSIANSDNSKGVLKINTDTDELTTFGSSTMIGLRDFLGACSCLGKNGKIYGAFRNADTILVVDPSTDTVSVLNVGPYSYFESYLTNMLLPNGEIGYIPNKLTDPVLSLNTDTNTVSVFTNTVTPTSLDASISTTFLAPDGFYYTVMRVTGGIHLVKIDHTTNSVIVGDFISTSYEFDTAITDINGRILLIDNNDGVNTLRLETNFDLDPNLLYSRYFNKIN